MSHRCFTPTCDMGSLASKFLRQTAPLVSRALHLLILVALILSSLIGLVEPVSVRAADTSPPLPPPATTADLETPVSSPVATQLASPTPPAELTQTPVPAETQPPAPQPILNPPPDATPVPETTTPISTTILITESIQLTLAAHPPFITPGQHAFTDWQITGLTSLSGSLELVFYLPAGFSPHPNQPGIFDPQARTLTLPVDQFKGRVHWQTEAISTPPYLLRAVLQRDGEYLAGSTLAYNDQTSFVIAKSGGQASGLNGKVTVTFPEDALTEEVTLTIREAVSDVFAAQPPSGQPFELNAYGNNSGAEVEQFQNELTIAVSYREEDLWGPEEGLTLVYFDETQQSWFGLPSRVDTQANIVYGYSDHFSAFDLDIVTWQTGRPPTLNDFQVSSLTGASTYQKSFWLPPGPAGLQPSLSLSYNSQIVDATGWRSQAAWVGMGWSLSTSYIQRNMSGSDYELVDDVFQLVIGGASYSLLPVVDPNAPSNVQAFHTSHESFLRVWGYKPSDTSNSITSWRVWAPDGTQYYFGEQASQRAQYPYLEKLPNGDCDYDGMQNWYWGLSRQVSIHGQQISYSYTSETANKWFCDNAYHTFQHAIYPATITYPNNGYQIQFILEARRDYESGWVGSSSYVFYDTQRLDKIQIVRLVNSVPQVIRVYEFNYASDQSSNQHIFPTRSYTTNGLVGYRSTLTSIQEFSSSAPNAPGLPPTTFTYDDMHLSVGDNGYGGQVAYEYEIWHQPWDYVSKAQLASFDPLRSSFFQEIGACSGSDTTPPDDWQGDAECEIGNTDFIVEGNTGVHVATLQLPISFLQPGGRYYLRILGTTSPDPNYPQLLNQAGLKYNDTDALLFNLQNYRTGSQDSFNLVTVVEIPTDATQLQLYVSCKSCQIYEFYVAKLLTRYRVIEKQLLDGISPAAPSIIRYSYDEAAVNDLDHSVAVWDALSAGRPDKLLIPQNSSFLGHAVMAEQAPDGRITTTYFHLDDHLRGRAHTTTITSQTFKDSFDTSTGINSSAWSGSGLGSHQQIAYALGDQLLQNKSTNTTLRNFQRVGYSLSDQPNAANTATMQFQVRDATATAIFRVFNNTSGTRVFGLRVEPAAGVLKAKVEYNNTSNWQPSLTDLFTLAEDTWYVLQLTVDDTNGFYLRVWERANPENVWHSYANMNLPGQAWQFKSFVGNGTSWLDEYTEGRLYSTQTTSYQAEVATATTPTNFATLDTSDLPGRYDLDQVIWIKTAASKVLTYDGDADFVGTRTEFQYDVADYFGTTPPQYGNLTRQIEKVWNPANNSWTAYRATRTRYYPLANQNVYLVSLPTNSNQYTCTAGNVCDFEASDIVASTRFIYDNNNIFNAAPALGKLTAQRTHVCWTTGNQATSACGALNANQYARFSDQTFSYDAYGNLIATRIYLDWGTKTGLNLTNRPYQESVITYDPVYHTYPVAMTNALGVSAYTSYNYDLGVPNAVIDANANRTTAGYDSFGRITWVCLPGQDCSTTPSMALSYADYTTPFSTLATQKLNEAETISVKKFYNGFGQLLQSKMLGVNVGGVIQDVLTDYYYDENGRLASQSLPYAAVQGGAGLNRIGTDLIETEYDLLNRPTVITNPDNSFQAYAYDDLLTTFSDALQNERTTLYDAWGRAVTVTSPEVPSVSYAYDVLGRLTQTDYGDATTAITYNLAGQKTAINDPDLGPWEYIYSPSGQIASQTDARGCTVGLNTDLIGRLTAKSYSGGCGVSITAPTYTYDGMRVADQFSSSIDPLVWYANATASVVNGEVRITGDQSWSADLRRQAQIPAGNAVRFSFLTEASNASGHILLQRGTWGTSAYRRWSLSYLSNKLYLQKYVGSTLTTLELSSLQANTWYEGQLVVDDQGEFRISIWQRNRPETWSEHTESATDPNWLNQNWQFLITHYAGTLRFDRYQEYQVNTIGYRTGMSDATGTTHWAYDRAGRVVKEAKNISNLGTFVTQWGGFDAAGRPGWMRYPAGPNGLSGEQLDFSYLPQSALESLYSASNHYYYLQQARYDQNGRTELLNFGATNLVANPVLQSEYAYFDWDIPNGMGRLKQILTGTPADPDALQNTQYFSGNTAAYDALGNIEFIYDTVAGNPLVQSFEYDSLSRLTEATISGGTGEATLAESYSYHPDTGNLLSKTGMGTYTYAGAQAHAVSSTSTGWNFSYDANGNLIQRDPPGADVYQYSYDAENRIVQARKNNTLIATFGYDGAGQRVLASENGVTTVYLGQYYEYVNSNTTPSPAGALNSGIACQDAAIGSGYILYSATQVQQRFAANPPSAGNARHFICVKYENGQWLYDNDLAYLPFTPLESDLLVAAVNFTNDTISALVGQRNVVNGIQAGYASGNLTFITNRWNGRSNPGEFTVNGSSLVPWTMQRLYYYVGSQRIALRENGVLYWSISDHLGSTAIIANADGSLKAEIRYSPWGEVRYASGSAPTDFTFTGQRSEIEGMNLLFYNARWYDPALGRFVQADTLVPDPYNPLAFDRYQYVYSNPLRYRDPSGHCIEGAEDFDECMQWADAIEDKWGNINVITCVGSDNYGDCVGWTAGEMVLLHEVLSEYILPNLIDTGQIWILRTQSSKYSGLHQPAYYMTDGNRASVISISDYAWITPPSYAIYDKKKNEPNAAYFKGVLAHELTHAATWFHPDILVSFEETLDNLSFVQSQVFHFAFGYRYPFELAYKSYMDNPDVYAQIVLNEYLAISIAGGMYDSWIGIYK